MTPRELRLRAAQLERYQVPEYQPPQRGKALLVSAGLPEPVPPPPGGDEASSSVTSEANDRHVVAKQKRSRRTVSPPCIDARQLRAALAGARIGVRALAVAAQCSTNTIMRAMRGEQVGPEPLGRIKATLESHDLHFGPESVIFRPTDSEMRKRHTESLKQSLAALRHHAG